MTRIDAASASQSAVNKTFLVVDDDDTLRQRLEKSLRLRGFEVAGASNAIEAVEIARSSKPDMAVLDLKMPGKNGLELLAAIRECSPATRCIILTGYGNISNAVEAIKLGAANYVTKPADADQILAALEEKPTVEAERDIAPPSLAEAQWEHIHRVLSECNGNISEAARVLDIPRRTLQRKLKKMAP